jgi:hypothetical protein
MRATGGTMLNFGYWDRKTTTFGQAQNALYMLVGKFAQLHSAKNVLDVESGFSAPAIYWKDITNNLAPSFYTLKYHKEHSFKIPDNTQ